MKSFILTCLVLAGSLPLAAADSDPLPDGLYAEITTPRGVVTCELFFRKTPLTVTNFVGLAEGTLGSAKPAPFFDGLTFHRVVPGFVVQGGDPLANDPLANGDGGPGYKFPDEMVPGLRPDAAGILAMANQGPDTNGSQFFLTLAPVIRLNYLHSIFGRTVRGVDVLPQIKQGDKMTVKILRLGATAKAFRADEAAFKALVAKTKKYSAALEPGPTANFDDADRLLPADVPRAKAFNFKLANFERATGVRLVARLFTKAPPAAEDEKPGAYMHALAEKLGVARRGALAAYFAESDEWRVWIGDESAAAFMGHAVATGDLQPDGRMHEAKQKFLDATKAQGDRDFLAAQKAATPDKPLPPGQGLKLQTDAMLDGLIDKLEPEMKLHHLLLPAALFAAPLFAVDAALRELVAQKVAADYPSLDAFYKDLHTYPELSLMEERTSAKVAGELRATGFDVTEKFGGYGVVAVLKNGAGPTVLIRSDLDALPVQEETGLPYASKVVTKDLMGRDVPVMQACGHDIHMSCLVGVARTMAALRDRWNGTLVLIGQPAEERGVGARAMLTEGLYRKFPKPDFALALHDSATLPAGTVGTVEGYIMANVDTVEITVRGIGGHGAYPQATKDPIVLAARIVMALQTIVSRETRPVEPAVVTVGSIHGGTKSNIIPDEVKLQLTLRSYSAGVRAHTIEAVKRICRGEAIAAGLPDDLMPIVTVVEAEFTPATYNDPALTRRVRGALVDWLGADAVKNIDAEMGGEDFSQFGLTVEKVPICLFRVGAVAPAKVEESQRTGVPLPSLHSSKFAPVPEPTIKTGITAMTAAALELLAKR